MAELRERAKIRVIYGAQARVEDIIATVGCWSPSRQESVRRQVGDTLARLRLEIESGRRSIAQVTAAVQRRVDDRGPPPHRDPGAAFADELVLNFLLAVKFTGEGRVRSICEKVSQTIHLFGMR